jgi:hypothetical protein
MSWTPAVTLNDRFSGIQPDWLQFQVLFDDAVRLEPLPRSDWSYLRTNYILERPGYGTIDVASAKSILPEALRLIAFLIPGYSVLQRQTDK